MGRARGNGAQCSAHPRARRIHARGQLSALSWPAVPIPAELRQWQEDEAAKVIADAIKLVEDSAAEGARPEIKSELFFSAPVPTLVDLSKETQMVGCRGRGAVASPLAGSVSTGLIHHAHCPVAVIHDEVPSCDGKLPVLVGIDGSRASELATAIAFDEASWRGVDLVALHLERRGLSDVPSMEWSAQQAAADRRLPKLAGWQERYPEVTVHRLVEFETSRPAIFSTSPRGAQLVVVGSHGRGGFAGMLLGSVSTAVAQAARVPVIVARQPGNSVSWVVVSIPPVPPCELSCSITKLPQTPPLIRGGVRVSRQTPYLPLWG